MRNIVNDEKYIKYRAEIDQYFGEQYARPTETENIPSASGALTLSLYYYRFREGYQDWSCSRGVVKCKNGKTVEIKRNYSHFPFCWIDEDYLLCGEDYQGYSIVDLSSGEVKHFVPEDYYEGAGFCWVKFYYLKGNDIIAVGGCYWGGPAEIVFYDFSQPMELPYKEILRVERYAEVIGWKDKRRFEYIDPETKEIKAVVLEE